MVRAARGAPAARRGHRSITPHPWRVALGVGGRPRQRRELGRFVDAARDLTLGWGEFPDGAEVIYLYDKGDNGVGYALNLACGWCSEWEYAPFAA
jgi:hypothetical protein